MTNLLLLFFFYLAYKDFENIWRDVNELKLILYGGLHDVTNDSFASEVRWFSNMIGNLNEVPIMQSAREIVLIN